MQKRLEFRQICMNYPLMKKVFALVAVPLFWN